MIKAKKENILWSTSGQHYRTIINIMYNKKCLNNINKNKKQEVTIWSNHPYMKKFQKTKI